jgi:hypothetical protein
VATICICRTKDFGNTLPQNKVTGMCDAMGAKLDLKEGRGLKVFKNKELRKIFELERE